MAVKTFHEVWLDEKKKPFDDIWGNTSQTEEEAMREIRKNSPFYYANHEPEKTPLENRYIKTGNKDFDLGYVGEKAWKGVVDSASGILNAGANILDNPIQSLDSIVRFIPDEAAKKLDEGNFLDGIAKSAKDTAQNMSYYARSSEYDPSKMTSFERFLGDAAGAIGGMAPSIATGALAGPTAGLAVMGTSVFGNSLDQALDEGAEYDNAVLYGIASAGVELATEKLMGGMPFLGKGLLDDVTKEWLGSKLASGTGKAVLNYVKEAVGEGAEEYIAEVAGEFLTDIYSDAKDEEEIVDRLLKVQPDAFYSFLLGSATGGVMGAPGLVSDVRNSKAKPLSTETKPVETDPMKAMINENAKAEAKKIVEKPSETEFDNNFLEKGLKSDNVAVKMEAQRLNEKKIRKLYENRTSTEKQINDIVKTMNSLGVPASVLEDYIEFDALGAASSKGIELSKKADKGITRVAVHEIKHLASTSGINNQLSQVLRSLAEMDGIDLDKSRENIVKEYAKRKKALDNAAVEEELDAYIAQEYLFTEHGIKGLVRSNLTLAEKVKQLIRNIRIRISGTEFEKQLLKAEQLYTEAINEVSKSQSYKTDTERRNMYAGEKAKHADMSALDKAKLMERFKRDPDDIWYETGWIKKQDGKWRFEIDDSKAKFNFDVMKEKMFPTLKEVLDHPTLYENYPHLADMEVYYNADTSGVGGAYDRTFNSIWLNKYISNDVEQLKSILLHEVQHAIQNYEGFQGGSNLTRARQDIEDENFRTRFLYNITDGFVDDYEDYRKLLDERKELAEKYGGEHNIPKNISEENLYKIESAIVKSDFKYGMDSFSKYQKANTPVKDSQVFDRYWKTLGEVEARDTSERMEYDAADRHLITPETEGYVTDSKGNSYSIEDVKTIKKISSNAINEDGSLKSISEQVKDILNNKVLQNVHLVCGKTPIEYERYGLDSNKLLTMKQSIIRKKFGYHNLTPELIEEVIESPDKIILGINRNDGRTSLIFDVKDSDGNFMLMALNPNSKMVSGTVDVVEIRSLYGKENIYELIEDEIKHGSTIITNEKSRRFLNLAQFNMGGKTSAYTDIISDSSENNNTQYSISNDDIRFAIGESMLERSKDPAVRARAQMEKRIRHTFLFNKKSNPLRMYDVTSRIENEFERTGKISEDLRKELFTTAYEETLRSSDVSYKDLPEFKQMLQEDLNRAVLQYENTLIKERELKKFAEENDIDASQIKFNPATGFLKNVKPEELPDKIISYKKLKSSLKSDLIGHVNNYAGGKVIDELIDKAAIEIVEDGFISSPTKFKIRQEMIENGYSINADAMNDNKELYDFIKSTKLNVPRGFGREIQDYERTKKLLKTSTQDGQPIDKVYQELRSKFGEFFPDNLTNPADQYQQIYDVMAELEPTRLMLEDSEMYNAEMRQYLEDTFTDRLEDFKNQVLYRSQKDYYDRAAKKQVAYDEAMNEVSEKISEKFFKDNQEIDELKNSEHVIKGASIEDLSEIIAKIQDRGALSKTLAQNLDAMANGDVVLRAKLSEIFEKPLRQAKKTYVTNQKRVLNDVYKRIVTDLGIKMGSKESAAMMWYGEGKKQLNKVKGKVESDKLEFTPYTLDDLKNEFPNTWQNIVAADKIMREYYDDYVDRINESLQKVYAESVLKESVNERRTQIQKDIREAQERLEQLKAQRTGEVGGPDLEARIEAQRKRIVDLSRQFNNVAEDVYRNKRLKKRSDYYHHFQEVGFAENIQQILNVDSANNIANALAGISEFTKPKSKWEKFMQRRSNTARYEEDAIKGFLKYAPAAEYKISFDPYVAQLRGTIQDMIKLSDEANMNNAKVINWLTNYTNSLAGKTNPMDRWLAHTESGRTVLQFLNKVNARVKANAVVGNLNSAVSQFYNLPNGTAVLTANGGAKAMADIAKGSKDYSAYVAKKMSGQDVSDNPINQSVFLQERFIDSTIDQFDERLIHKPAQAATFLLTFGDQVVAEQLWFSAYNQAQRLGKNDPIAYADDLVARAVGGRGIGEVPLMQQSQVVKLIAPFQVEVNNAYQLMKQLGSGALKDKDKLMALVVMYGITWIMNEINEALTGNRVGMDIYNAMQDAVENWDAEKNPVANTFTAAGRLTGEILSNVPMGAQVAQMVVPDEYDREKLFGEADPSRYGTGNIGINAISDPLTQLATGQNIDWQSLVTNFGTPMGGKQLNRMYKMAEDAGLIPRVDINTSDGLQTSWKPGAYNDKGELKYQIDTSDPLNILKGFIFGTYATKEGKEYLDNEYKALSEKKTSLYEKAVKEGADSIDFYKALREANASKNLTDKNGKSINNSMAALNRQALEKNDSFDDVKKLVNSGAAKYTDFGLNKTVFEWTQEEFNRFLKSLNK